MRCCVVRLLHLLRRARPRQAADTLTHCDADPGRAPLAEPPGQKLVRPVKPVKLVKPVKKLNYWVRIDAPAPCFIANHRSVADGTYIVPPHQPEADCRDGGTCPCTWATHTPMRHVHVSPHTANKSMRVSGHVSLRMSMHVSIYACLYTCLCTCLYTSVRTRSVHVYGDGLRPGVYSYGVYSYGVYSYGVYSYGVYSYGVYSYGVYGMAYIVMAYIVMAFIVMAYIVMAFIVMALYSYGLYSYGDVVGTRRSKSPSTRTSRPSCWRARR